MGVGDRTTVEPRVDAKFIAIQCFATEDTDGDLSEVLYALDEDGVVRSFGDRKDGLWHPLPMTRSLATPSWALPEELHERRR